MCKIFWFVVELMVFLIFFLVWIYVFYLYVFLLDIFELKEKCFEVLKICLLICLNFINDEFNVLFCEWFLFLFEFNLVSVIVDCYFIVFKCGSFSIEFKVEVLWIEDLEEVRVSCGLVVRWRYEMFMVVCFEINYYIILW